MGGASRAELGGGGWRHAPRGRGGAGPPGGLEQSGRGEANLSRRRRRRWFCLFLLPPAPGNRQPRPRCACGVPPPVRGSLSLPAAALGRVEGLPFPSGVRPRSFPPPPPHPSLRTGGGWRTARRQPFPAVATLLAAPPAHVYPSQSDWRLLPPAPTSARPPAASRRQGRSRAKAGSGGQGRVRQLPVREPLGRCVSVCILLLLPAGVGGRRSAFPQLGRWSEEGGRA